MFKKLIYVTLFCLLMANVTFAQDENLVGWWMLDDGSGDTAADSSVNSNDGTLVGGPQWVTGRVNGALMLDGAGDYIDLPIGSLLSTLENCTVASWVNWSGAGGVWQRVFDFGSNTTFNMFLTPTNAANVMRFAMTISGYTDEDQATAEVALPTGWHHIAVTLDIDNTTHKLYLDGEVIAENDAARYTPSSLGESTQNWIGRSQYTADPYFNGLVDDFRIYDRVLSKIELHGVMVEDARLAWDPIPDDGEVDVPLDTTLVWKRGVVEGTTEVLYNEQQIYIGTDINDVNSATVPAATIMDANEYDPDLDYETAYYWRIDQTSDLAPDAVVKGSIWSFTTANFIVLEDFEDYNDNPPDEIWNTWIDGYGNPNNGSIAGYPDPDFVIGEHFMETDIVHGGAQSMPVFYNNGAGLYSEVTKTLNEKRDWTVDDVLTLTLFYYGDFGNGPDAMYIALNNSAVMENEDPRAVLKNEWTQWDILLQDFADQGVNLANVSSVSIGFGDRNNPAPGGSGHVFFDDMRLSRLLPEDVEPLPESVDPGTANRRAYYAFENNVQDTSGGGFNGTVSGNPQYVPGPTDFGMALALDGNGDFVTLPIGSLISSLSDSTIACWVNWPGTGGAWQRIWDFGSGEDINMFLTPNAAGSLLRFAITSSGSGGEAQSTSSQTLSPGWHHIAVTIDPTNSTHTLYLDAKVVAQNTSAEIVPSDLGQTSQNWIGLSQYPADPFYNGSIDEFQIYNRVLSGLEVLFLAGQ